MIKRRLYLQMWKELSAYRQMVFVSGPRQSGKTTFAKMVARNFTNHLYVNWDDLEDRARITQTPYFYEEVPRHDESTPLIIFDEIHKYDNWKNYLKGVYDRDSGRYKFLVSGSGRLDIYRKGGDSLAGRYLQFRLWPFTLGELKSSPATAAAVLQNPLRIPRARSGLRRTWNELCLYGGFPDPHAAKKVEYYRAWSGAYNNQLLREEIRSLVELRKFGSVEVLFSLLRGKIGSPLSMQSLARDCQVSFESVKTWLEVFERFYLVFRLSPWTKKIPRAITKEKKLYLLDYARIASPGAKFENMVAVELWRAVTNWTDRGAGRFSLHYVRNKEKEEVDFLIAESNRPILLVEAKSSDDKVSRGLEKIQGQLGVPVVQLVNRAGPCKRISNGGQEILVVDAPRWLAQLG
jgi:predicted AAA+ superfamily ATPase